MLQYFDTLQDESGNALAANTGTLTVTAYPGGGAVTIYSTNGTASPISGSKVATDVTGQVSFFIPDGAYIFTYAQNGTTYKTRSPVQILDPMGFVVATDTGLVNALAVSNSAYPVNLFVGMKIQVDVAVTNTGPATFNLNSTGNEPITMPGGAPLTGGTLQAGGIYQFEWDGTEWQVIGGASQTIASQTFTGVVNGPPDILLTKNSSYTGGSATFVTACFQVVTNIGANDNNAEWAILGVCNNSATGGANVAGYFQGNRETSGTGPTWAGVLEAREIVAINNPTTGLVSLEIDNRSNGTDTNFNRVAIAIVASRYNISGAATTMGIGILIGNDSDGANTSIGNGIFFGNKIGGTCNFANGINMVNGQYSECAILLPANAPIGFDAAGANQILWDGVRFRYQTSGSLLWGISATGNLNVGPLTSTAVALYSNTTTLTGATQQSELLADTLSGTTQSTGLQVSTQIAASTAVASYFGVNVGNPSLGSSATITTAIGLRVAPITSGGTTNISCELNNASGTGSYNLFCSGTAQNQMNGPLGVNGNTAPAQVSGWGTPVGNAVVSNYNITDAGGANSNTNKALAQIIHDLKAIGFYAS